ncbi:MAG: hypothetical protein JST11_26905 [Acidobacteria bacterium]|nr:hypothetical protein [Acidobacteriota bacterium]
MKQELSVNTNPADRDFDLGTWLGRRQAFSLMAGRASAADVECLRAIRDERLYKAKAERWSDFCAQYVGASKTQVDRLIRYLEDFGAKYFELTNVTRISPETYKLIAPHVSAEGIQLDGKTIAIEQENGAEVAAAVAELRRRAEPSRPPCLPAPSKSETEPCYHSVQWAWVAVNLDSLLEAIRELKSMRADEREEIAELMRELNHHVCRLDVDW